MVLRFVSKILTFSPPGGSAKAAGDLVEKLGGEVMGYLFILELDFLKGRDLLNAPVRTLLAQEEKQ